MANERDEGLQAFLDKAANHRLLNARDEVRLGRKAQAGDNAARLELVNCNIRLVVSISRYYRNRGLPMEDIIQDGILGLDRASRKFNPELGYRFSTYATLWIRQSIQRGLQGGGSLIRLPPQVADHRIKVKSAAARTPDASIEALAEELGLEPEQVERALDAAEVVTSLDREVSVDDEYAHTLLDTMTDPNAVDPSDISGWFSRAFLRDAMATLPETQRRVIELRFGFAGHPMTLKEVADALALPVTTTQSAQRDALAALRTLLSSE